MKCWLSVFCSIGSLFAFAQNTVSEHYVTSADGTKLYTLVSRPEKTKKLPVIVIRTPYAPNAEPELSKQLKYYRKTPQYGYVVIVQHCRGAGMSEGDFIPYVNERTDGLALLEWIRKQDFYNGEIYLSGGSYSSSVHGSYLNVHQPDIKGIFWAVQDTERYNIYKHM